MTLVGDGYRSNRTKCWNLFVRTFVFFHWSRDPNCSTPYAMQRMYLEVLGGRCMRILHYVRRGGFEGMWPHPLFDSSDYLFLYPDLSNVKINRSIHHW